MTSLDGEYAYEIKDGIAILGRENEMKEYLADKAYAGRHHAKILKEDDKVYIENFSNTDFTFVNNHKIAEKTELHIHYEIGLGGNETNGSRQLEAAYLILRMLNVYSKNSLSCKDPGSGNRIGIWGAGCHHSCKGCSNPELWKVDEKYFVTIEQVEKLIYTVA